MPPTDDSKITALIQDLANGVDSFRQAQDDLLAEVGKDFDRKGWIARADQAIRQLETQFKAVNADLDAKLAKIQRLAYTPASQYRGVFACEDQARAFGLLVLAGCGRAKAADVLKRDYPEVYSLAMTAGQDAAGGTLVPHQHLARILDVAENYGTLLRKAFRMPMGSTSASFPSVINDPVVYCPAEGVAPTASDVGTGMITLNTQDWYVLTYYSKTLDETSAVAVGELVARTMAMPWRVLTLAPGQIAEESHTIPVADISDWITAGVISAPADLVGWRWYRYLAYNPWASNRRLEWPNEHELDHGDAEGGNHQVLIDGAKAPRWSAIDWTGRDQVGEPPQPQACEVLVRCTESAPNLKRLTIGGNTANALFYGGATGWLAEHVAYKIVDPGNNDAVLLESVCEGYLASALYDPAAIWATDCWAGRDVLLGPQEIRYSIAGNSDRLLYFGSQPWRISGASPFSIVRAGT